MGDDNGTMPAWAVTLRNGSKVSLIRDEANERNMLVFRRDEHDTTIVLSDAALAAVVALAVTRAGVPVHVDGAPHA